MKIKFTLFFLLLSIGISYAQTIRYVKPTASGAGNGTSWANASADFQGMINASEPNDQVWVAAGTYKPTSGIDRTTSFSMKNGVGIYGGFGGAETQLSQQNYANNVTILSGDIGDVGINTDNSYHVVLNFNNGLNSTAILDGFTITKGYANSQGGNDSGGGVANFGTSPKIANCIFSNNYSIGDGGGLINYTSSSTIINCIFIENNSSGFGGAATNSTNSQPKYLNCNFAKNSGKNIVNFNNSTLATLSNCIIWGNYTSPASSIGYSPSSLPTITYSIVQGGYSGTGNLNTDPLFVNVAVGDLRLKSCSPAINTGDNTGILGVDLANNPRIYNGIVDMGAYEFQGIGARLYVNGAATGANNGLTWADAFTDLQSALNYSCETNLTEIWVAKGTYKPSADPSGNTSPSDPRTKSFVMINGVSIYGGFSGTETTLNDRSWATNITILSGEIGLAGTSDNSYRIINNTFTAGNPLLSTSILDGFTLEAANANGPFPLNLGGAIWNTQASPTIRNCTFRNNFADAGGGIFFDKSSSILSNCLFINNACSASGSAISCGGGTGGVKVLNSTFYGNTGGTTIENQSSSRYTNCIFWGNGNGVNGGNFTNSIIQGGYGGAGNLNTNPLFVNAAGGDFSLQACSPAINTGDNTGISGVDLANNPRIYNSGIVDMGIYEYQGVAVTTPTGVSINPIAVCQGMSVNLSATCSFGTVNWYNTSSGGTALGTGSPFSYSPSVGNIQTFYASCVGSCESSRTASSNTLNVYANPTATAISNSPICAGTTLSLSSTGGTSYAWMGVNSFSSTLQNPTINPVTTLATGTYQVVVTNENGCTAVATTSVIVNPTPVTPTTQANTQIIFGGSITLTATGCSTENDVLKWYQSADNVLVSMPVSPTMTSNYYAKCETILNGITCISSQSADLTVTVLSPTPPIATVATTCINNPLILTATGCSGSIGTFELKWYQNSDNMLVAMPVSPSVTTDYYAKCEQTFNTITAVSDKSNVVTLTVLNPTIPVATGAIIYNGNSTTLTAMGCTGEGFIVKWFETATNTLVIIPISPIVTTQYYAKCEQTANGVTCSSSKSNDVIVKVVNRIFVDITKVSAPIQNGNSWASAYGNLQTGLAAANAGEEVWVAKGIYKITTTLDRTISFNIPNNVIVYGGFAGTENAVSERNFRTNVSTLSGDIGTQGLITDNSYHVVVFSGSSNSTVLDGFTITGGNASFNPNKSVSLPLSTPSSTPEIESGGGIILANAAMPMIINCTVMSNSSVFGGGLFAGDASKPSILFCKFMGNQATFGAGIYLQDGSHATINNALISGNRGVGGLYNNNSNPTITNTTFSGNGGYNGGIFNSNSQPAVRNSIIWGNSTPFNDAQSIITYSIIQGGYAGTGNLNYDPQFVNQAPEGLSPNLNGDYHLKANSLGIDRGDNDSISLTDLDLDGNLRRYNGGKIDMGAYEFQGNRTAKVVISAQTGDWEINSTWEGLKVPQLGDVVIIDSNHIVTINNTATAKSIQYQATGQVKFKSTSSKLNIGF